MHVTSLPGPYGIGDLGPAAHAWVDWLARARQAWWQILPLGPPGAGDSPYQCFSAFAGNTNLVSPDALLKDGLISRADLAASSFPTGKRIDFARAGAFKNAMLSQAFDRFRSGSAPELKPAFEAFRAEHRDWLEDFSLFMSLKDAHPGVSWTQWPRDLVLRRATALRDARRALGAEVERHQFSQFLFFRQLDALRDHARRKGVKLIGDLPMFVSAESADVWASPRLFLLDAHRRPKVVAGVPPDYFSKTGQRWGNPLYNWPAMRRDGFGWWARRVRAALAQADLLRIDHFRGLEACWEIPARARTAQRGRWVKSPGHELLAALRRAIGHLPFIAEDLGLITPEVEKLRDNFELPGMRVLQFGFGGDSTNPHLPHNYVPHSVVYTGTHDNDTVAGWFKGLAAAERARVRRYVPGRGGGDVPAALIQQAWASVAVLAVTPIQDVLGLGSAARMNVPGSPTGNWGWRLAALPAHSSSARLAEWTDLYGRAG